MLSFFFCGKTLYTDFVIVWTRENQLPWSRLVPQPTCCWKFKVRWGPCLGMIRRSVDLFVKTAGCFKSTLFLSCFSIKPFLFMVKKKTLRLGVHVKISWRGQRVGLFVETAELFRSKGAHRQSFPSCVLEKVGSHTGGKILSLWFFGDDGRCKMPFRHKSWTFSLTLEQQTKKY